MRSYHGSFKKILFFKSFTGLTVLEFDDIYDNEVTKRYAKNEIQRLFKKDLERVSAGRPFKLDLKFEYMFLVYFRFFITYILDDVLFDLDEYYLRIFQGLENVYPFQ